jgi:hypothetical protein
MGQLSLKQESRCAFQNDGDRNSGIHIEEGYRRREAAVAAPHTDGKLEKLADPSHYTESSARENLIEHVFLGELLRGLWRKNVRDLEVLRPEVDSSGYDLALEFKGVTRHVQLKSSFTGAGRSDVTARVKLLDRPSACILWIFFDPDTVTLGAFLWFGGAAGEKIPPMGDRVAKHRKPNAMLEKAHRPAHGVIPKSRFERLDTIDQVIQRLIGV